MFSSGMNFGLGEEIDALRETVARWAQDKLAPLAADIDRNNDMPRDLWTQMGELGLLGMTADPDFGGTGLAILPTRWRWRRSAGHRPRWA
jgi:isovaleryl-CoA dehydrogenase